MIDRVLTSLFCSNLLIGNHVSLSPSSGRWKTEFRTSSHKSPNEIKANAIKANKLEANKLEANKLEVDKAKRDGAQKQIEPAPKTGKSNASPPITSMTPLAIAVVLGPGAVGTKQEYAWLENLERVSSKSSVPKTFVHNLGLSSRSKKSWCDEGRYALVLAVEYRDQSKVPILSTQDCQLGRELSARTIDAVTQIDLIGDIWIEHQTLSRFDSHTNRRFTLNHRLRNGLIAGGAILVVGGAIAIVFAATLRRQQAVLTVSPDAPSLR